MDLHSDIQFALKTVVGSCKCRIFGLVASSYFERINDDDDYDDCIFSDVKRLSDFHLFQVLRFSHFTRATLF